MTLKSQRTEDISKSKETKKRPNEIASEKLVNKAKSAAEEKSPAKMVTQKNVEIAHIQGDHGGIDQIGTDPNFKRKIVWFNTLGFLVLHLTAVIGIPYMFYCHSYTLWWSFAIAAVSGEGVTLGAHRLYSHKAFKATKVTKAILLILQTIAGQNCMYIWVRDHRQHHKFSDTDADPHNAHRGFFFSHVGWLMSRKHPEVIRKGKSIDMSDLEADELVMFQKKYYKPLYAIFALAIPILTPVYLWNENIVYSFLVSYMTRYIIVLNLTWLVNSAAHFFGTKPYDRTMRPVECAIVSLLTAGEGWHNYHHTFPWDYRAAELGMKYNFTTLVINSLERFGFVYDLKTAPYSIVEHRVRRTGDGTHRTIRPIADDTESAREIQNEMRESVENDKEISEKNDIGVENDEGVVGGYVECMDLIVNGLEGVFDDKLEDDIEDFDNNNGENDDIYSSTGKFEVCELGYNVIRQRPI